jgi:hypothetical protein
MIGWLRVTDIALVSVSVVLILGAAWLAWNRSKGTKSVCCPHAAAKGRSACYDLEGISAFGDVVEKCRYCETREVFVVDGGSVDLLKFSADEWRLLRGKVPTEGFQSAQRVAARSRRNRGEASRGEATGRERE